MFENKLTVTFVPLSDSLSSPNIVCRTSHKCSVVDARETAPLAAFEEMYDKDPTGSEAGSCF